jgi:poly(A) polymerase/tRNA nucleotidyltransferase (CCA-adding enzyme)
MAFDGDKIIDPFGGRADCTAKLIRTVGSPEERFGEDALRLLRACRFAAHLDFQVEPKTRQAIAAHAAEITKVSWERIRDELLKTVAAENAFRGIWLMHITGLLKEIIPELEEGVGVGQNKHHIYTIFMHNLQAMQYAPTDDPLIRLAALLHDVGKARTKEGEGPESTFHNHEVVGAQLTEKIMKRLKFSRHDIERVAHLVRQHMFYYNLGEITDAGVRRLIKRIGRENWDDLLAVRIGDRMGSGTQKEKPWKLVELERRIRDVEKDPMSTNMLKLDGTDIMEITGLKPGREVGVILNGLLEDILEDPSLNTEEYLTKRAKELFRDIGDRAGR